jgi:hypothetical protein
MSILHKAMATAAAALLALAAPAHAHGGDPGEAEVIQRCLKAFGIAWRLPYAPALVVERCESAEGSYRGQQPASDSPRLELALDNIGFIDERTLTYAELHNAVFAHFDALFRAQGFRSAGVQTDPVPAPWVSRAQYLRDEPGGRSTLQFEATAANIWQIRLHTDAVAGR